MKYFLTELHAHTRHSDGDFSTEELLYQAYDFGYEVLAITDHNTMAPVEEASVLADKSRLLILPGMEWTTFFGHMLVIGADHVVDWRTATEETIDESLQEVKAAGGVTGIAHPFSIGSPICTGCHWDFHIKDYALVDFIEVWNRLNPDEDFRSQKAYEMWDDLLNQGQHIACSAGRDWHRLEAETDNTALTYVGTDDFSVKGILNSLKSGNFYISLGPKMALSIEQNDADFYMGQELHSGVALLKVITKATEQKKMRNFGFEVRQLVVWHNNEIIECCAIEKDQEMRLPIYLKPGYLRIEIFGDGKGKSSKKLIISNAFYIV